MIVQPESLLFFSPLMVALLSADVPSLFQRYPTDKAYFIAKEILTTERTYLKDLEVITVVRVFGET